MAAAAASSSGRLRSMDSSGSDLSAGRSNASAIVTPYSAASVRTLSSSAALRSCSCPIRMPRLASRNTLTAASMTISTFFTLSHCKRPHLLSSCAAQIRPRGRIDAVLHAVSHHQAARALARASRRLRGVGSLLRRTPPPPSACGPSYAAPARFARPNRKNDRFFAKKLDNAPPLCYTILCCRTAANPWGCSSPGRALEWHSRGKGFDPPHLHHKPATKVRAHWARTFVALWGF